jgi:hypothetical protein
MCTISLCLFCKASYELSSWLSLELFPLSPSNSLSGSSWMILYTRNCITISLSLFFWIQLYLVLSVSSCVQRYDPDPAAKAAAASVLASKLGADSGLKVYLGDESQFNAPTGKSSDVEVVQSGGLRNRKRVHTRSNSAGSTPLHHSNEETPCPEGTEGPEASEHNQLVVSHQYPQGPGANDGGWIARIAALLVGEDPTQSYALICGNCHVHNGESHLCFFRCTPAFIVESNQEFFCT